MSFFFLRFWLLTSALAAAQKFISAIRFRGARNLFRLQRSGLPRLHWTRPETRQDASQREIGVPFGAGHRVTPVSRSTPQPTLEWSTEQFALAALTKLWVSLLIGLVLAQTAASLRPHPGCSSARGHRCLPAQYLALALPHSPHTALLDSHDRGDALLAYLSGDVELF